MSPFKSGFVGVLGQTNVGKSTFLNAVIGERLLITSPKPQTTRNRIRCIYTTEQAQIVFVDTPGLHRPRNRLSRYILRQAFRALRGLDLLLYMVEPWGEVNPYDRSLLRRLDDDKRPILLLVNKIDTAVGKALPDTLLAYAETGHCAELIPISARKKTNLDEAIRTIISYLPPGKPYFPADAKIDRREEFLIAELIREKVFNLTKQEIPYCTAVRVKSIEPREDGLIQIQAEIIVDRSSQKGIIVGKGGRMIKEIGTMARTDIESLLGAHVFLDLQVRTCKGWARDTEEIKQLTNQ